MLLLRGLYANSEFVVPLGFLVCLFILGYEIKCSFYLIQSKAKSSVSVTSLVLLVDTRVILISSSVL